MKKLQMVSSMYCIVISLLLLSTSSAALVSFSNASTPRPSFLVESINATVVTQRVELSDQIPLAMNPTPLSTRPVFSDEGIQRHPSIARSPLGELVVACRDENKNTVVWAASDNDGQTYYSGIEFDLPGGEAYPSVRYKQDSRFIGTMVPSHLDDWGGVFYLLDITNPTDLHNYSLQKYSLDGYDGWFNIKDIQLATAPWKVDWNWGMASFISHITSYEKVPGILFPESETAIVIRSYTLEKPGNCGLMNCYTTDATVDHKTLDAWSVYEQRYNFWGRRLGDLVIIQHDMKNWYSHDEVFRIKSDFYLSNPAIAAHDNQILILAEQQHASKKELICFYGTSMDSLESCMIDQSSDGILNPNIRHIDEQTYVCTYLSQNKLLLCVTDNGGSTWTEPTVIDSVISEYDSTDISDYGAIAMYTRDVGFDDIDIWLETMLPTNTSDLQCTGSLTWKPQRNDNKLYGNFTIENQGQIDSSLDWSIIHHPAWGDWVIHPSSGQNLLQGQKTVVDVEVSVQDLKRGSRTGQIVVVNEKKPSDMVRIPVRVSISKQNQVYLSDQTPLFQSDTKNHHSISFQQDDLPEEGSLCQPFSHSPSIEWEKTFGGATIDYASEVIQCSDGSFVAVGQTESDNVAVAYLIKITEQGDILWEKTFGGPGFKKGNDVVECSDKGYAITGIADYALWLVKTNEHGEELWNRSFRSPTEHKNSLECGYALIESSDGDLVITGRVRMKNGPRHTDWSRDVWVIKTDKYGEEIWNVTFDGGNQDEGRDIIECANGDYLLTGVKWFKCETSEDSDVLVVRINGSTGEEIWNQTYGNQGAHRDLNFGNSIVCCGDDEYAIVGKTELFDNHDSEVWLLKIDGQGNILFTRRYGSTADGADDEGFSVDRCADDGLIITGRIKDESNEYGAHTIWILRTNKDGEVLWEKTIDTLESSPYFGGEGQSVITCQDKGYVVLGTYASGEDQANIVMIKFAAEENDPPIITLQKPKKGIYRQNYKILPFFTSVVIGDIDVVFDVQDPGIGVHSVVLSLDGSPVETLYSPPYQWTWNVSGFGRHELHIYAEDRYGYSSHITVPVWTIP